VKERSLNKRSAAKFECADLSPFESDASRRKLDASIFAFAEEVNLREILKLLCLGA
jgi:hypothetical protein